MLLKRNLKTPPRSSFGILWPPIFHPKKIEAPPISPPLPLQLKLWLVPKNVVYLWQIQSNADFRAKRVHRTKFNTEAHATISVVWLVREYLFFFQYLPTSQPVLSREQHNTRKFVLYKDNNNNFICVSLIFVSYIVYTFLLHIYVF